MQGAVIFDMDGVIIDSEPLWRIAMAKVFNASGLPIDDVSCAATTGMRIDEVIKHWNRLHPFTNDELKVQQHIEDELCGLIRIRGKAMPGFPETAKLLKKKNIRTALATSSSMKLVTCVLDTLGLNDFFLHVQSAENLDYGKPHPEVFLQSAKAIGVAPSQCLAIEDSLNGIISAKAAGMKVIAVPEEKNKRNPKFVIADLVLNSLEDFNFDLLENLLV